LGCRRRAIKSITLQKGMKCAMQRVPVLADSRGPICCASHTAWGCAGIRILEMLDPQLQPHPSAPRYASPPLNQPQKRSTKMWPLPLQSWVRERPGQSFAIQTETGPSAANRRLGPLEPRRTLCHSSHHVTSRSCAKLLGPNNTEACDCK